MNGALTPAEARVWTRTWERLDGYDHGYRAYAADEAVKRHRTRQRTQNPKPRGERRG